MFRKNLVSMGIYPPGLHVLAPLLKCSNISSEQQDEPLDTGSTASENSPSALQNEPLHNKVVISEDSPSALQDEPLDTKVVTSEDSPSVLQLLEPINAETTKQVIRQMPEQDESPSATPMDIAESTSLPLTQQQEPGDLSKLSELELEHLEKKLQSIVEKSQTTAEKSQVLLDQVKTMLSCKAEASPAIVEDMEREAARQTDQNTQTEEDYNEAAIMLGKHSAVSEGLAFSPETTNPEQ